MPNSSDDHPIYRRAKPIAIIFKISLQMIIGVIIVARLVYSTRCYFWIMCDSANPVFKLTPILEVIGYGLAISSGIDLAYMLFTPELDEAVDPLIIALSAASIIVLSKEGIYDYWYSSLPLVVMISSIVALFWVRRSLVEKKGVDELKSGWAPEAVVNSKGSPLKAGSSAPRHPRP
jgi:hypothetical protein